MTTTRTTTSHNTPSPPLESITTTPTTPRSIRQEITIVHSSRIALSSTIDYILRGALYNVEKGAMASVALDQALEARQRPSNIASRSKRQVKIDGLVYIGDIQHHISVEKKASIERRWCSTIKKHQDENRALRNRLGQHLDETPTRTSSSQESGASENLFYIDLHGDPTMALFRSK
jgi:hypothetical protein